MIPSTNGFLQQEFAVKEQPSKTYRMDMEERRVRGFCDGIDAVRQAVFRILNTERYQYVIYSWKYGIETIDLYGEPVTYVCPELERRVQEALLMDQRITAVTDFTFDTSEKGVITAFFTVKTIYGELTAQKEVTV